MAIQAALLLLSTCLLVPSLQRAGSNSVASFQPKSSRADIEKFGRSLASSDENECLNNQQFYPIHWGDSSSEKTTCLQVVQSNQDSNSDSDDKEDWILTGGSSATAAIVGTAVQQAYMQLFNYLGGLRWSFYVPFTATEPTEIADCGFANYGLQSVFLTAKPMHVFVFETLTGNLLYQWKEPTGEAIVYRGLETRLQSEIGIFLGFQWFTGAAVAQNWMIMEMD